MDCKISVIIPNFNYARFLERRIISIANQTIKPDEIIFLDDCSTDNSLIVAEQILSKIDIPYRIIPNETNQGVFKQWLKGIELAQYDYFWIAEADDYCELNFLEVLLPAFDDLDVVMSYCKSVFIANEQFDYQYDTWLKNTVFGTERWSNNYVANAREEITHYLSVMNILPNASAILFNRKLIDLKSVKHQLSAYTKAGDWMFYILVLSQNKDLKIAYNASHLNYYYRHDMSTWMHSEKNSSAQLFNESLAIYFHCFSIYKLDSSVKDKMLNYIADWIIRYSSNQETNELFIQLNKYMNIFSILHLVKQKYCDINNNLQTENNTLQAENNNLRLAKNQLMQENGLLMEELREIKLSRSWKLIEKIREFRKKYLFKLRN